MSSGRDAQNGFVHPIRIFPGKVLDEQRNVLPPLASGGVRGRFDHGYALTRHSSQGLTTERVLVVDLTSTLISSIHGSAMSPFHALPRIIRNRLARPGPAILSAQAGHPFDQRSLARLNSILTGFS